jgi:Uma2 family endonuclease
VGADGARNTAVGDPFIMPERKGTTKTLLIGVVPGRRGPAREGTRRLHLSARRFHAKLKREYTAEMWRMIRVMSTLAVPRRPAIEYPDQDGEPLSDNTLQFHWIFRIEGGLERVFRDRPDVFVAGDLLWYPVEGEPKIRSAPDAMVVLGRPKGYRGSYKQWEEGGIAPQVVFEVLSPGNRAGYRERKFQFYERYGVQEYYIYDPDHGDLVGWRRSGEVLEEIPDMKGFQSPLLKITFLPSDEPDGLVILGPDGEPFLSYVEVATERDVERRRADEEAKRADEEAKRADEEAKRAERERERADRMAAKLRELGENFD